MLFWLSLSIVAVLVGVFFVPFTLDLSVSDQRRSADLRWAFGLVRVDLFDDASSAKPKKRKPKERKRGGSKPNRLSRALRFFSTAGIPHEIGRLLRALVRATHPRDAAFRARVGLGDPAATGVFWGSVGPLAFGLREASGGALEVEPDFVESCFEARGRGHFTVLPAEVVFVASRFVFSPPVARGLYRAWRT